MQQSTSSGQPPNTAIFSVSRLNGEVRQLLEQGFGQVWLVGEISNFAAPGSGHWYFTLKDSRAQIKAAMFRGNNQRVRMRPQNGMQVMVRAKLTVYEPRGDYQLIVEHMEDAGAGLLQQQYEQLKAKLAAQGLFAPEHKRPLPERVQRVGIITSPTGAAIRDVLSVLKRRDPSLEVIIYPSAVQGEKATADLRAMLRLAQERNEVDVLILTRGGGSLEDLWCFNDPELAHLIHASTIPIISAVGHEVDFTIADFVADVRAATPSAAAELVSRDHQHEIVQLQQRRQRAERYMQQLLMSLQRHQQHASQRLQQQHPQRQLQQHEQRLDELNARHNRALSLTVQKAALRQQNIAQRLQQLHPAKELQRQQRSQAELTQRAQAAMQRSLKLANQQLQQQAQALQLISPLQTVARGYALIQTESGDVVRSVHQLAKNEVFSVKVADGDFTAKRLE